MTFLGYLPDGVAELQSIVTMEAMASGLPVIAADAMALPELAHHGENGFLFPEDDVQALAAAAVTILCNEPLRRQMARKSEELVYHDCASVFPNPSLDTSAPAQKSICGGENNNSGLRSGAKVLRVAHLSEPGSQIDQINLIGSGLSP